MSPKSISQKTIKKLFALSGNKCYFPRCNNQIVDIENGSVVGEICHIKAKKKRGSRYDEDLTDKEINAFENLVLMCRLHHKVIDDDPDSYTVKRLLEVKSQHESQNYSDEEPDDFIINNIIINYYESSVDNLGIQSQQSEIQLFFNKLVNFLNRLIKGGLTASFIKQIAGELNRNRKKEFFGINIIQTNMGFYNKIELLNGLYKLNIESHLEGTYFTIWRNDIKIDLRDFNELINIFRDLKDFIMDHHGINLKIPNTIPICHVNLELKDKPFSFILDNTGEKVLEFSKNINYKIENIGEKLLTIRKVEVYANTVILFEKNMNDIRLKASEYYTGKFDENEVLNSIQKKKIDLPTNIKLCAVLDTKECFFSETLLLS